MSEKKITSSNHNFFLGCFQNPSGKILLTGSEARGRSGFKWNNLKEECLEKCRLHGYSLAGFQYEDDCFCGEESLDDLIEYKINEQKCDWRWGEKMATPPNTDNITLMIYHTGSLPNQLSPMMLEQTGMLSVNQRMIN